MIGTEAPIIPNEDNNLHDGLNETTIRDLYSVRDRILFVYLYQKLNWYYGTFTLLETA